jgi:hypothetical protein
MQTAVANANSVLPSTANFDAAKAAAINGTTHPAIAPNTFAAQFLAIIEQRDPELALAYKQRRMTSQQEERASG